MEKEYFVYILTNKHNKTLYTGVTGDLGQRISQHKNGVGGKFSRKYKLNKVIYTETFSNAQDAICREKQIKSWPRRRKVELIERLNPGWRELL